MSFACKNKQSGHFSQFFFHINILKIGYENFEVAISLCGLEV